MHSGLGVDTYPVGIDEKPESMLALLRVVHGLACQHGKPLSVRLVSDRIARVGARTDFRNPYLRNVRVRPLIDDDRRLSAQG